MFETELILNNRPLCEIYDDDVEEVLTPNRFIFGRQLESRILTIVMLILMHHLFLVDTSI